jgi:hypothetical protein
VDFCIDTGGNNWRRQVVMHFCVLCHAAEVTQDTIIVDLEFMAMIKCVVTDLPIISFTWYTNLRTSIPIESKLANIAIHTHMFHVNSS